MKISQFWGKEFMSLSQSMMEEYINFPFSHNIILKQNYFVILIVLSFINNCQNYIGLYCVSKS